jgi:four helix bundle protein
MHNFKELKVWQMAIDLSKKVYVVIADFPSDERFGLANQLKRSVVSVPSNIAEGAGRGSEKEFAQFLSISLGSSCEVETQLILAKELNLIPSARFLDIDNQLQQIQKMLFTLIKKFRSR